ncbi:mechanosensitive ion channel family protein [Dictyobacter aurantiacus]|uniref:Small-conductance mechanosensitive ion channel n=1 Tax=Dictyobacter aurantiacus TaxID=1936993 RepID=A0A401ZAY9_9CHLR|nr:small-conductance mechanosensitive ion channel [Dictyobacter aurantiacus]GCE04002.1 hypothetical protein KDAU_13310 [Dictyobacter aurantiacus]
MGVITNWGVAIYSSLASALAMVFAFIPKLVGFLVILLIGWIVASLLEKGLTLLLRRVGFDRLSDRIGFTRFEQQMNLRMDPATLLGKVLFWFVFLIFLVPAFNALELNAVSTLIGQIVGYIPNVFVAIIVLFLGMVISAVVADLVRGASASTRMANPNFLANIARYAILGFSVLIALEQLQIAPALITTLFTAVVGSIALACGLAFGLGGRDSAKRLLERSESRMSAAMAPASGQGQIDMSQPFNQPPPMVGKAPGELNQPGPGQPTPAGPTQGYPSQTTPTQGYPPQTSTGQGPTEPWRSK